MACVTSPLATPKRLSTGQVSRRCTPALRPGWTRGERLAATGQAKEQPGSDLGVRGIVEDALRLSLTPRGQPRRELGVAKGEDRRGEKPGVGRVADSHCRHGDPAWHLDDREQ